jgi:hypothetical protein
MSVANNNELFLMAITRSDNAITLRIDRNGWAQSQLEGAPVVELKLLACSNVAKVFDKLNNSAGKPVYYEVVKDNDKVMVSFWINYPLDELQVDCAQVNETLTDYTFEDLKSKMNRLSELYAASSVANQLGDYIYHLLKNTLSKMIQKELDLYQHKIEFFAKTNPEKATKLTGEIQAYQKVLALMGLGEVNGQAIAPQIRDWLSRIWADDIENQVAYAKSVESRIADMGKIALFPLLEILKNSDPRYGREVSLILGLIDPTVQEKILEILQLD